MGFSSLPEQHPSPSLNENQTMLCRQFANLCCIVSTTTTESRKKVIYASITGMKIAGVSYGHAIHIWEQRTMGGYEFSRLFHVIQDRTRAIFARICKKTSH